MCNEVKSGYAKVECDESCSYHKDKQKKVITKKKNNNKKTKAEKGTSEREG